MKKKTKVARKKMSEVEKKERAREKRKAIEKDLAENGSDSAHYIHYLKQNVLRRSFKKWPSYYLLYEKSESRLEKRKDRRGAERLLRVWQCAECRKWFVKRDLAADHIEDVGSPGTTPEEMGRMIWRMYVPLSKMQLLCNYTKKDVKAGRFDKLSCHYLKTHGNEHDSSGNSNDKKRNSRNSKSGGRKKRSKRS